MTGGFRERNSPYRGASLDKSALVEAISPRGREKIDGDPLASLIAKFSYLNYTTAPLASQVA